MKRTTNAHQSQNWLTIIGIGEEGFDLLTNKARSAIENAHLLIGNQRQLALIPKQTNETAKRELWPTPMMQRVDLLLQEKPPQTVIIASGDPLCWGIGQHFSKNCTRSELTIIPSLSIVSRIAAHMHWPTTEIKSVSLCSQPLKEITKHLKPEAKLVLLSATKQSPKDVAELLVNQSYGSSEITILEDLGSDTENITAITATELNNSLREISPLNSLAIALKTANTKEDANHHHTPQPGLPDSAFASDGQLTKSQIRAITLAHLRPKPAELLWDIGSGSGSIAIEWLRTNLANPQIKDPVTAIGIEKDPIRLERAKTNAATLGVPDLMLINVAAPEGLKDLPAPDAIFIGGGVSTPNLLEIAISALEPGGRLVANAVTIEGETRLIDAFKLHGGELNKIAISTAEPLGRFKGWRPQMPITQWVYHKIETSQI